jgi:hypothetical protein
MGAIGYPPDVIHEYQEDVNQAVEIAKQREEIKRQRQRGIEEAAVRKAAAAAKAENKRDLAAMAHLTPIASLKRWAKIGLIGLQLFRSRMKEMGYTDEVIGIQIDDFCNAKGAQCVETGGSAGIDDTGFSSAPA